MSNYFNSQSCSWLSLRWTLLLAFSVAVAFQGSRGLYEPTEGRYALCAAEMLHRGDILVPTLDNKPHWTKPPLAYWSVALGMTLLGLNEWGARFYLVLAFCLTVLIVGKTARLMWDEFVAKLAAMVFATLLLPIAGANAISTDMLVTLFSALSFYGFWLGFAQGKNSGWLWMWGALGAGFLSKGPPALMPLAGILPTVWLARRRGYTIPRLFHPLGLMLFVVIGGSWYAYFIMKYPDLLHYWFADEVVARVASEKFNRNSEWHKPFTLYLPVLLIGTQPWLALVCRYWKQLVPQGLKWVAVGDGSESPVWFFLRFSIFIPILIFSLAKSRLWLYMLPLMVPIALVLGRGIHQLIVNRDVTEQTVWRIALGTTCFAILMKGIVAFALPIDRDVKTFSQTIQDYITPSEQYDFILIEHSSTRHYYGLEFYLNSLFTRFDLAGHKEEQATAVSSNLQSFFQNQPSNRKTVIIANKKIRDILEQTIRDLGYHPIVIPTHPTSRLSQFLNPTESSEMNVNRRSDERDIICFLMS